MIGGMDTIENAVPGVDAARLEALRLANAYVIAGVPGAVPGVDFVMKQAQRYFQFLCGKDYPESAIVTSHSEWLEARNQDRA